MSTQASIGGYRWENAETISAHGYMIAIVRRPV